MDSLELPKKEAALQLLFDRWQPELLTEQVPLELSKGRILAGDVYAVNTLPVVRSAMKDSVALSSKDFEHGIPDTALWQLGLEYDMADMGDDFSDRYDAALKVEDVTFSETGRISFQEDLIVEPGSGIKEKGSTVREGELLLAKDTKIIATDLAALATGGIEEVAVLKKPIVAIIPVGSELIPRGSKPKRGQNIEANSIMLENLLLESGAAPRCYPIVSDNLGNMAAVLDDALAKADIVVVSGGSSKGVEDLSAKLLQSKGELLFHGVASVPGRPLSMSIIAGKPVINLPGPTLAAFNCFNWCLRTIIAKCLQVPVAKRPKVKATLSGDLETPPQLEFMARLNVWKGTDAIIYAEKAGSAMRSVSSNGVFVSPIGCGLFKKGSEIEVELLRGEEFL